MSAPRIKLGTVADFVNGKAFQVSDWSTNGVPIIRIQNLNGSDKPFNFWAGPLDRQVTVKPGDLLLAWSGTPGTSFGAHLWAGCNAVLNQHIFRVDLDRCRITPGWAKFVINHSLGRLIDLAHGGVGLKHVTRGAVESLEIPLPPLAEQRRLAEVLDRADAVRAKRRAALARIDTLTQATFLEMFGDQGSAPGKWPIVPLCDLARQGDSINYGVVQPGDDVEDGVPLVRVGDLQDGRVNCTSLKRIAHAIDASYKRSRLHGDEILVSCVGSTGIVVLADQSVKGFNIARAVARIPLSNAADRTFIAAYLKSHHVQRYFANELRTVSQPTLNIKQIGETPVIQPPLTLQQEFARRVAAIEQLKLSYRESLDRLGELFASLQQRAFRGEL